MSFDSVISKKITAAVTAGLLATTFAFATPAAALAQSNEASVGEQTSSGVTELTMILQDGSEHAQSDGNLAFSVPSSINFVAMANGSLLGPDATSCCIINESSFPVHISAVRVTSESSFALVDNARTSTSENAYDLSIGPASNQLSAASYTSKKAPTTPSAWNLAAASSANDLDQLSIQSSGNYNNLSSAPVTAQKIGQIQWYVSAGSAQAS